MIKSSEGVELLIALQLLNTYLVFILFIIVTFLVMTINDDAIFTNSYEYVDEKVEALKHNKEI